MLFLVETPSGFTDGSTVLVMFVAGIEAFPVGLGVAEEEPFRTLDGRVAEDALL